MRTQTAAEVVAEGTRWVISSARALLDSTVNYIDTSGGVADAQTMARFEANASSKPAELELGIYDAAGNEIASATSAHAPSTIADKEYFRSLAEGATWALSAQEQSPETGEATFAVVRRLDSNGAFAGAATIIINARVLERLAEPQGLGVDSTISIVRSVKDYLHTLVANIHAGHDPRVEVVEEIEDVAVDKDAATPLRLIVNEVVSNSFKHAFSDGRAGTVHVSLVSLGDGQAQLTVRDNGVGFDPDAPTKGIGRRLIGGFTAQLRGESSHTSDAEGSVFTLVFPLARG